MKPGTSRYKLVSDAGRRIGEIKIILHEKDCGIALLNIDDIENLSIQTK